MEAFFWAALGFFVLSALAGGVFVAFRGWEAWQSFVSLAAGGGAGVERLLSGAERLASHTERTAARAEELLTAVERLERSLARARILVGATGEARDLIRAVRGVVPTK
jgi:methyl-accepting chemotaxis protein